MTTIKYSVKTKVKRKNAKGKIKVYDILGNKIATLVDEEKAPGNYEVYFDASSFSQPISSAVYFYQLRSGDFTETRSMLLIK